MRLSAFRQWLVRFGLEFEDPADEAAFIDRHVRGWVPFTQGFLVLGAMFFILFAIWDVLIDPADLGKTLMLRVLVAVVLCGSSAMLFTDWGKKHVELVVLSGCITGQAALVVIFGILDNGYDYAAVAFLLMYVGTASAFPFRAQVLAIASVFLMVSGVAGHLYFANAQPGWLPVNILLMGCGVSFGALSAYFRERGARIQFRTDRALAASKARVEELLHSILPRDVVQRMQDGESEIADSLGEVSIVFADLAGFTALARQVSAQELVKILARLFSAFDKEAERYGIDRIKTIGDAYMAIGGLGRAVGRDHAEDAADFALAVQTAVRKHIRDWNYPIDVRIGLHIGPVIAGVIGRRRPAFDCWGEAVNLASRLESNAPRGEILVSESAHVRLKERFTLEPVANELELKGIGLTKAYRLVSRCVERTNLRLVGGTAA